VPKRFLCLLAILAGALGLIGCVAATLLTWQVRQRVTQATDRVFAATDESLDQVIQRLSRTRDRVHSLRLTSNEVRDSVKNWTAAKVEGGLKKQLASEARANRIAGGLDQADQWVEISESSMQLALRAMEIGHSLGFPMNLDRADVPLTDLRSLREDFAQARESLEGIRAHLSQPDSNQESRDRIGKIVAASARVIGTLGMIDSRLDSLVETVERIARKLKSAQDTTNGWRGLIACCIIAVVCWMAIGQASLLYLGWRSWRG